MISKEESLIDDELIYINRNLPQLGLVDRFIFLVNRLYKNFYDGLNEARTHGNTTDHTFEYDIENEDFLNRYGYDRIKKNIILEGFKINSPNSGIIEVLKQQFNNNNLKDLSSNELNLINVKEHLLISPFIYYIRDLKEYIIHELSLLEKNQIKSNVANLKAIFSELVLRLNYPYSWDAYNEGYRIYEIQNELWENEYGEIIDTKMPDLNAEELAKLIGVDKRRTIDLNNLINWIDSIELDSITKISKRQKLTYQHPKLAYKKSPIKLKELFIHFFNTNNISIDNDQRSRVGRFIINCIETNYKNYSLSSQSYESINFLNKRTILPFISLLVYLNKKELLVLKSSKQLSEILISELKHINKPNIGLSNQLRDNISQKLMTKSANELIIFTGFKNENEIKMFIKN